MDCGSQLDLDLRIELAIERINCQVRRIGMMHFLDPARQSQENILTLMLENLEDLRFAGNIQTYTDSLDSVGTRPPLQ
ncbi:MAG: hypothetical protein ABSA13_19230 [Beijerinckiaceae bacterium]|jgi:hypothetical protein